MPDEPGVFKPHSYPAAEPVFTERERIDRTHEGVVFREWGTLEHHSVRTERRLLDGIDAIRVPRGGIRYLQPPRPIDLSTGTVLPSEP